jgi:hypothetical protein
MLWQVALLLPGMKAPVVCPMATRSIAEMYADGLRRLVLRGSIYLIPPTDLAGQE